MKSGPAFLFLLAAPLAHASMTPLGFEGLAHNVNLTTQYAALGATFTSADTFSSIRSTVGYQPSPARSGQTVVTTKTLGLTTLSFSHDVADVSGWVLSPSAFGAKLTARDARGATVATATHPTNAAYGPLAVHGAALRSVTIQAPAGFSVIDDLSFTSAPVPEPGTLAALGLGVAALRRGRGLSGPPGSSRGRLAREPQGRGRGRLDRPW